MNSAPDFKTLMLLLSTALGYSFIVERILEGLSGLLDRLLQRFGPPESRSSPPGEELPAALQRIEEERKRHLAEERAQIEAQLIHPPKPLSPAQETRLRRRLKELKDYPPEKYPLEIPEQYDVQPVLVEPATRRDSRLTLRTFWMQMIGTFAGIVICFYSRFGLFEPIGLFHNLPDALDWLFTGILIGSGSQPIHFLIQFITQRKVVELKVSPGTEVLPAERRIPAAPQILLREPAWDSPLSIPYDGGIDRDKLEAIHLRPDNPNLIVYHHTAMNLHSTFADVVETIRKRGWITAYHCVITEDGGIHPYCRWDRYGNHARGYNLRSLGIAFNGNFETDPAVPYSNANGDYGPATPTDEQLRSGAMVIALWTFLYKIPLDFREAIIPHHQISRKSCPGSQFPEDKLKSLVRSVHAEWKKSEQARREIALFKQKQFLYV